MFIFYKASHLQRFLDVKRRRLPVFQECSRPLPSLFAKRNNPSLVFSITTNGPVHLGSSFPDASVHRLRSNTRSPALVCFSLTFCLYMLLFHFGKTVGSLLPSYALILANLLILLCWYCKWHPSLFWRYEAWFPLGLLALLCIAI
jgi:hypothetical protein